MKRINESGAANALILPVVVLAVLFIAAASFAVWAFSGRQDYKNNVDAKIATAEVGNTKTVQAKDAADYAEAAKSPLKTYVGPDAYGSLRVSYPKTWSAYIDTAAGSNPLDAYFHTDYVPSTDDDSAVYNLRVQIQDSSYDTVVSQYSSSLTDGGATASPYKLPKVPSVTGTRFDGQVFDKGGSGSIVVLPIRDKTLVIWTESTAFVNDFNTYILPNITFSP